jgi:hypothetical protein
MCGNPARGLVRKARKHQTGRYTLLLQSSESIVNNLPELQSEMNINYTSIVSMITFFLPHLLKLSVSCGRVLVLRHLTTVFSRKAVIHISCPLLLAFPCGLHHGSRIIVHPKLHSIVFASRFKRR